MAIFGRVRSGFKPGTSAHDIDHKTMAAKYFQIVKIRWFKSLLNPVCEIWTKIGIDLHKLGHIWDLFEDGTK